MLSGIESLEIIETIDHETPIFGLHISAGLAIASLWPLLPNATPFNSDVRCLGAPFGLDFWRP